MELYGQARRAVFVEGMSRREAARRFGIDPCGVSFVAVTQQFNTTTSMGRLTLNVLALVRPFRAGGDVPP